MNLQVQIWDINQILVLKVLICQSYEETENVAIYAFSSGKFLDARK